MRGHREPRGTTRDGRKRWRLRINLGARADGTRATYSEIFVGSARAADTRLAELVGQHSELTVRNVTVAQLFEEWNATSAPALALSTLRNYRRNLRRHVLPVLGTTPLAKVTVAKLERRYRELEEAGLTPSTVHQVHSALSALLSDAVRWGWIPRNPASDTKRSSIEWQPPRVTEETGAAVARILGEITEPGFRCACILAAATGARRGELVALRWSDLDLDAGTVRIARALGHDRENGLYEKDTKRHQERTVALDLGTLDALRRHRAAAATLALEAGVGLTADSYLFTADPAGRTPWPPNIITTRWTSARKRAGAETVRFHDLRHYHATQLLDLGTNIDAARDRLGHRDISTTNRYAHGGRAADRRAADAIGAHLAELGIT